MMNYWQNLSERDRLTLSIGIVFTIAYLFYLLVYSPLSSAVNNKTTQLKDKEATLAWMKQINKRPQNTKEPEVINNGRLLSIISTQLNNTRFKSFTYQLQQTGPGDIQINYEKVPYSQFLQWLWQLNSDYAILLKQLSIDKTDTPGVVKLTITLSAK
ncbi:putative general secretion pathway protein YghD [Legionella birminghamensis]|uniref:General secretion pathway protein M n=1 Tax=Legionella birminghamensis TaxID=28083 RepID=A0A378I7J3_9GAMM|nr:type II secretion system protein M [Legionella birminghamensis]KTC68284.1 putative general secretion pathway protein YghD [Legionella birminghamensis]STX31003.1 general secretion pathway protein M [Legionella birminghamensis]